MAGEEDADDLHVTSEALQDRQARRIAALERQVESRIAQVEDYQRRLAHAENAARAAERAANEAREAIPKAAEYDALMGTRTMKVLRLPRSWYALARKAASRVRDREHLLRGPWRRSR